MVSVETLTFSKPFSVEIYIQSTEIMLGSILISSLSNEHSRSFPFPVAFKKARNMEINLSVISKVSWCSVEPSNFAVNNEDGSTNFSLILDLDLLARWGTNVLKNGECHYEIRLDIGISLQDKPDDVQYALVNIPVSVNWFIDIPTEPVKKLQADRNGINFSPIYLPKISEIQQIENISITNPDNTRVICDIECPEWIKAGPARLVLDSDQTKIFSLCVDPNQIDLGNNQGNIHITNSDININVTVEGIAQCPAPSFERDISISIPYTDSDYTYQLEVVNIGNGELKVSVPLGLGDLRYRNIYNVINKALIPIIIPRIKMNEDQTVTREFIIITNSEIEKLKKIPVRIQYTLLSAEEVVIHTKNPPTKDITEKDNGIKINLPINDKKKQNLTTPILIAATFLITLFASLMMINEHTDYNLWGYGKSNRTTINRIKPIAPSVKTNKNNKPMAVIKNLPSSQDKFESSDMEQEQDLPENVHEQQPSKPQERHTSHKDISVTPNEENQKLAVHTNTVVMTRAFIKISIYSFPRAYVYIDGEKIINSNGEAILTPIKNQIVSSGKHNIKLVDGESKRTWSVSELITEDHVYTVNAMAGDW